MKKFGLILLLMLISSLKFTMAGANKIKTNYRNALVLVYSPANNVYEDENIKFEIYDECLWATNKTERTIFLDLSQCFGVHNGSSYPLFTKPTDEKKASQKGLSTSIEEFISIAPSTGSKQNETFILYLSGLNYGNYSTTETPSGDFSDYDERLFNIINEMVNESLEGDPKGKNYLGTSYRHLTEDESVNNIGVNVSYSFNKRSEEWIPAAISTWVSDVYFTPYYVEMPQELKNKEKRGFGAKKFEAAKIHLKADSPFEFEADKSPIAVMDWKGNFKKGTFELYPTKISLKKGVSFGSALLAGVATVATGGMAVGLFFTNPNETNYKSKIIFDGSNDDWGGMTYLKSRNLTLFNNGQTNGEAKYEQW